METLKFSVRFARHTNLWLVTVQAPRLPESLARFHTPSSCEKTRSRGSSTTDLSSGRMMAPRRRRVRKAREVS
jgi:hypothetical protein